ncbi:MAG: hypothetical protein Q4D51_07310 [Eubacteriales bacterium]|nr:hypothetical protein [Eubacteriales bacterium]
MTDQEKFQKVFGKLHASPEVLTEVMKMADSNKVIEIKKKFWMSKVAVAGLAIVLMGTTVFAAGKITAINMTTNTANTIKKYEKMLKQSEQLDIESNIPESFQNGYAFDHANVGNMTAVDDKNHPVKKAKVLDVTYAKKGAEDICLSIQPQIDAEDVIQENQKRTIEGLDVLYFEATYKFVPIDYQLTEEDKENEKKMDYIISYGSDQVEVKQNKTIYFIKDDKAYSLSGFDSKLSANEWFEMAEELIN